MIVVVCPGQGSQTPGFLSPWLEDTPSRELLSTFSDAAGLDLLAHGTTSDADTIRDTAVAQPLIVAAGLLTLSALRTSGHLGHVGGIAGHSVGEFTAAVGAGVLTGTDAVRLVGLRGRAMADAAARTPTGMSAIIGGDMSDILAHLEQLSLAPANYNGGGQLVVAGELTALAALSSEPPSGTRVIALPVAGAFHTKFMNPAVETLAEAASSLEVMDPAMTLWTNNDGSVVSNGLDFRDLLVGQVSSPVRWDLCMESFATAGVTAIIEVAPAGALVGLAKRALKGVPTLAIRTPDDLVGARDLIDSLS